MNDVPSWTAPLMQWIPLLPVWFVLLAGVVAALIFWQNCPRAALLTLLALLLLGGLLAAQPFVNQWLMQERVTRDWTAAQLGFRFMEVGAVLNLLRAASYGMLLAAVFIGRRPTDRFPAAAAVNSPPPLPPTL